MARTILKCSAAAVTAVSIGTSLFVIHARGAQTVAAAQREVLLQANEAWNGKPYTAYPSGQPQLTMLKLTIAPHTALPWHTHPVPNAAYVVSGTLTVHDRESGKSHVYHAGDAFAESMNDVHRGESGDEPAVLLITYAGSPGVPTSIPAKGEEAEY